MSYLCSSQDPRSGPGKDILTFPLSLSNSNREVRQREENEVAETVGESISIELTGHKARLVKWEGVRFGWGKGSRVG